MRPVPPVPTFALVGQPNEGKTTVMATLAEDDRAAISPVPGTTLRAERYPVRLDGREFMVFWDTPGFEHTGEVLAWFQDHDGPDLPRRFIAEFQRAGRFPQECEIFKPLAEGSAIIYVVDASRPVRQVDRQQIEILRRCGNPRIGVINSKEGQGEYLLDWQHIMATDFNHRHEFNGHRAMFHDRIRLLQAVRAVIPEWNERMDQTLAALAEDWDGRQEETTDLIIGLLRDLMTRRERAPVRWAGDEAHASETAGRQLRETIRQRERQVREQVRRVFHHSTDHWAMEELLEADLFSEKVWRLLGLTRKQLIAAGAIAGALTGGILDAHAAGATFLLGVAVGSLSGAALAWMSAQNAVHVRVPGVRWGPVRFGGYKLGGVQVEASVVSQSNLVWIVLDRLLLYIELASRWSHGRREEMAVAVEGEAAKRGDTSTWTRDERGLVLKFLTELRRRRGNPAKLDAAERAVREMLMAKLRTLTSG